MARTQKKKKNKKVKEEGRTSIGLYTQIGLVVPTNKSFVEVAAQSENKILHPLTTDVWTRLVVYWVRWTWFRSTLLSSWPCWGRTMATTLGCTWQWRRTLRFAYVRRNKHWLKGWTDSQFCRDNVDHITRREGEATYMQVPMSSLCTCTCIHSAEWLIMLNKTRHNHYLEG